jgi:hypothetical protein
MKHIGCSLCGSETEPGRTVDAKKIIIVNGSKCNTLYLCEKCFAFFAAFDPFAPAHSSLEVEEMVIRLRSGLMQKIVEDAVATADHGINEQIDKAVTEAQAEKVTDAQPERVSG